MGIILGLIFRNFIPFTFVFFFPVACGCRSNRDNQDNSTSNIGEEDLVSRQKKNNNVEIEIDDSKNYCSSCGIDFFEENLRFCPNCGKKL